MTLMTLSPEAQRMDLISYSVQNIMGLSYFGGIKADSFTSDFLFLSYYTINLLKSAKIKKAKLHNSQVISATKLSQYSNTPMNHFLC